MENELIPMDNSFTVSFKTNPCDPKLIIPLDLHNVQIVPESHAWNCPSTEDNRPVSHPVSHEPRVHVIDFTEARDLHAAEVMIRSACEKWGVFQIINHGIEFDLLDQADKQTMKLFLLPADRKILVARTPNGPTGYGLAPLSVFFRKRMWFEGFTVSGSPMEPDIKLWPDCDEDRTKFCDVLMEYQKEVKALTEKLIYIMLSSLELNLQVELKWLNPKPGDNAQPQPQAMMNLNYYPPCPDPTQAMGLAAHTDSSLVTLLYPSTTDTYNGLQVLSPNDSSWVPVEPIKGAMVVIIGDLMQVLTNGRFKNVLHHAVGNKSKQKLACVFLWPTKGG